MRSCRTVWKYWAIGLTCLMFATACSAYHVGVRRIDYGDVKPPKERSLGVARFTDLSSGAAREISLDKVRGGYGFSTPLHQTEGSTVRGVVSKGREYHWFAGVQWRLEF